MNSVTEQSKITKQQYQEALDITKLYRKQQKQRPKKKLSEKQLETLKLGRRKNPKLAKLFASTVDDN